LGLLQVGFIDTGFGTYWAGLDIEEHFLNFAIFKLHKLFKLSKQIFKPWLFYWSSGKIIQAFNIALVLELVSHIVSELDQDRGPLERATKPFKN